jgi:hypothetical protein
MAMTAVDGSIGGAGGGHAGISSESACDFADASFVAGSSLGSIGSVDIVLPDDGKATMRFECIEGGDLAAAFSCPVFEQTVNLSVVTCVADGATDCVDDVYIVLAGGTAEIKQRNETTLLSTVAQFEFT